MAIGGDPVLPLVQTTGFWLPLLLSEVGIPRLLSRQQKNAAQGLRELYPSSPTECSSAVYGRRLLHPWEIRWSLKISLLMWCSNYVFKITNT